MVYWWALCPAAPAPAAVAWPRVRSPMGEADPGLRPSGGAAAHGQELPLLVELPPIVCPARSEFGYDGHRELIHDVVPVVPCPDWRLRSVLAAIADPP